ncbi:spore germination protein GerPB [Bacillus sp. 179-C3.3 HS]|uniref:spore germination protein GerPB n=1 Tax=Bacillus sp. 179-C3.3 HS TaxID=3232162 RepID=UPI0039A0D808
MNFYINQAIQINYLRVEAVSNSSVLQIGSAGSIKALSNLYNTGSYVESAPAAIGPQEIEESIGATTAPFVPLQSPTS